MVDSTTYEMHSPEIIAPVRIQKDRDDQGEQATLRCLQMHPRVTITQRSMLQILRTSNANPGPVGQTLPSRR